MNRSITGAWASQRNKISLNSPLLPSSPSAPSVTSNIPVPPPPGSAAAAALARQHAQQNGDFGAEVETAATASPVASDSVPRTRQSSPIASSSSPVKRKSRSSRVDGSKASALATSSSKRPKGGLMSKLLNTAEKYTPPATRLADLGGISHAIEKILELIAMPLCHPEIYAHTGVKPPRGVLLHGPPGCGKTMLAGAVAGELGVPFLSISAPSVVSGTSGESEKTIRDTFDEAASIAPCILFIDEIDAITPKRETAQREMERRIVAQLLTSLDDLSWEKTDGKPVMIIGATNRPDSLDPALRRAGRFDHEIAMGVPDEDGREQILRVLAQKLRLAGDFDFRALAKATPGYVGADLTALTSAAGIIAVKRIFQQLSESDSLLPSSLSSERISQAIGLHANDARGDGSANEARDVDMDDSDVPATAAQQAGDNHDQAATAEAAAGVEAAIDLVTPSASMATLAAVDGTQTPIPAAAAPTNVRPSSSFFDALPEHIRYSSIASFLKHHPSPLTESQLAPLAITNSDFLIALPSVQPSSKREGFATVPDVSWADVGALHSTRDELSMAIVEPIKRPELFRSVGVSASSGVLLWGPPGCGKTLLAKAVANESRANFISVKGPELLNKYVGESEKAVRQVFARARTSSPCVIFFDELDALVPRRDDSLSESSSRVVNTLLTELDGLESRVQTYVIAATNRPDMIDPAMCRPGRLDKLLYVDLPKPDERLDILKTITQKTPLSDEVDLQSIAYDSKLEGFSGADLAALVREAAVLALRQTILFRNSQSSLSLPEVRKDKKGGEEEGLKVMVMHSHFVAALSKIQPSVSAQQRRKYLSLRHKLQGSVPIEEGSGGRRAANYDGDGGDPPNAPTPATY
ncbi:related to RIX7 - AAA-type ATPase required for biogenesis and nuclear export of 60S ribosomal subunits [Melanopsichium pennsylvanicum]|uniref:Related to RIX7 - AAA-type ATPase required for biogenesis and nuclear export of 60S ribosomal subunits n=2 Tax=Melanopsichium pennsylvanicum TaxID=63383 RepID=A0AAJ4XHX1_9BASI|nr:related to RIX7-AAA-type ATPase required for biogenesis and nuclear export of 60S ribosomal subunits [Melanopsichium pennsylvanicum 4]SNX82684.1 related to RIX7 - AAA-type ATPase required for biogenesis and nuclear export of 60S ribosomal subunits [Melanopsichium pennsylvanicum]